MCELAKRVWDQFVHKNKNLRVITVCSTDEKLQIQNINTKLQRRLKEYVEKTADMIQNIDGLNAMELKDLLNKFIKAHKFDNYKLSFFYYVFLFLFVT